MDISQTFDRTLTTQRDEHRYSTLYTTLHGRERLRAHEAVQTRRRFSPSPQCSKSLMLLLKLYGTDICVALKQNPNLKQPKFDGWHSFHTSNPVTKSRPTASFTFLPASITPSHVSISASFLFQVPSLIRKHLMEYFLRTITNWNLTGKPETNESREDGIAFTKVYYLYK